MISQLPLDLGFSRFIVHDPPAATRFVFICRNLSVLRLNSGCGCFVFQALPDEICFGVVLLLGISSQLLDLGFGCFVMHHLSAVARFRV